MSWLFKRISNPLIEEIVKQYLNPENLAKYLSEFVNASLDDPEKRNFKTITMILMYAKSQDPEFIGKFKIFLKTIEEITNQIEGETS